MRYRITIEVETPEGLRSGSSVYETVTRDPTGRWWSLPHATIRVYTRGEAVAVDLGDRGRLFMTMREDETRWKTIFAMHFLLSPSVWRPQDRPAKFDRNGPFQPVEILPESLPLLVRFRDLADPASVERVDPRDLAASFGPGVALKRATIVRTKDPIGTGLQKLLPWLPDYYNKLLDGARIHSFDAENRFANSLGAGDFSSEAKKK